MNANVHVVLREMNVLLEHVSKNANASIQPNCRVGFLADEESMVEVPVVDNNKGNSLPIFLERPLKVTSIIITLNDC